MRAWPGWWMDDAPCYVAHAWEGHRVCAVCMGTRLVRTHAPHAGASLPVVTREVLSFKDVPWACTGRE